MGKKKGAHPSNHHKSRRCGIIDGLNWCLSNFHMLCCQALYFCTISKYMDILTREWYIHSRSDVTVLTVAQSEKLHYMYVPTSIIDLHGVVNFHRSGYTFMALPHHHVGQCVRGPLARFSLQLLTKTVILFIL